MPGWRMGLMGAALFYSAGLIGAGAMAQEMNGVDGGLNSDNGAITGPSINRVNGINANGTPRQQDPGASMTNGAGNSAMTPGVTGPTRHFRTLHTIPPTAILHDDQTSSPSQ